MSTLNALLFTLLTPSLALGQGVTIGTSSTSRINVHGVCRDVTNNSGAQSLWVPTSTSGEWSSFVAGPGSATVNMCSCNGTPWGNVAHGWSGTAYTSTTPAGACSSFSEVRTCSHGTMSGSYTATSCTNGCTGTPWGNVSHGYSNTAYSTHIPSGISCSAVAQTRTCSNGGMSGSHTTTWCNDGCSGRNVYWSSCGGWMPNLHHGQSVGVGNGHGGFTGSVTASCSNGNVSLSGGSCAALFAGATFTSPGTYSLTIPPGTYRVRAVGAGGGGGRSRGTCAYYFFSGSGGAAVDAIVTFYATTNVTVTVGTGGNGGFENGGACSGGAGHGSATTFGGWVHAGGGLAGANSHYKHVWADGPPSAGGTWSVAGGVGVLAAANGQGIGTHRFSHPVGHCGGASGLGFGGGSCSPSQAPGIGGGGYGGESYYTWSSGTTAGGHGYLSVYPY